MKYKDMRLWLPALLSTCLAAAAQSNNNLPSQITTLGGKTYKGVAAQAEAVWPDGIVIRYQPEVGGQPVPGGVGHAGLKFRDLPDEVSKMFGYDAKRAEEFETLQAQATGQFLQAQTAEERAIMRYRSLAELNRSLAGDEDTSYSLTLDSTGKLTAQGVTRTTPAMNITNVTIPAFTWFGQRHGLVTDFVPVPVVPNHTVVVTK